MKKRYELFRLRCKGVLMKLILEKSNILVNL